MQRQAVKRLFLPVVLFILLSLFSISKPLLLIMNVYASPDIETKSPTTNYAICGKWFFPADAYSSNDVYTYASTDYSQRGYGDYGFSLGASDEITKVEVGLEGYSTTGGVGYYVSWDDGASWSYCYVKADAAEDLQWHDVTDDTEWTATKLDNDHLKTKIFYQTGSGCYGLDAEVGLWEGGMKYVRDIKVGDVLTGWNTSKLEIKGEFENWNITNFVPATVTEITIHEGEWNVLRIIMESVYRPHDFKDVLVTPDHVLPYYKVEYEPDGSLDKIEMETQKAEDFGEDDYVFGFMRETINWTTEEIIPAHFEPYKFYNVTEMIVDGVADIKTDCKWFMGHYMLQEKQPWTGYVDWLPVRVTYSTGEEEEEIDCNWIGVDNTVAGISTQFSADWTDMNQTNGLSYFRFQTNNTGSWLNDTWSDSWNGNWSIATYALNVNSVIAFRFYVNDTLGTEHASTICFFLNAHMPEDGGAAAGHTEFLDEKIYGSIPITRRTVLFCLVSFILGIFIYKVYRDSKTVRFKIKKVTTSRS